MKIRSNEMRRTPLFLMIIVTVLIILSLVTIIQVFKTYKETGYSDFLALTLSASAIVLSIYIFLQVRRKPFKLGFEPPKVSTIIRCSKCGFETKREFKEGDYVLKEAESCPKCNSPTFIYMIFRETEEGKKEET